MQWRVWCPASLLLENSWFMFTRDWIVVMWCWTNGLIQRCWKCQKKPSYPSRPVKVTQWNTESVLQSASAQWRAVFVGNGDGRFFTSWPLTDRVQCVSLPAFDWWTAPLSPQQPWRRTESRTSRGPRPMGALHLGRAPAPLQWIPCLCMKDKLCR